MAKSNDFENKKKKKKENKEMSTGKFPQYHLHASTKKSCTYQIVCHQYKKLLHLNYYLQYLNYRFLSMDFELRFWI